MMEHRESKRFNDAKHVKGEWDTRVLAARGGPVRFCVAFLSQKRKGVDELAKLFPKDSGRMVLDAGAGTGAYSAWFASRSPCRVVSLDISFAALRKTANRTPVCADLHALPFKAERFCAAFSVDTLGHVADVNKVLDELLRCAEPGAPLFLHSECADYRRRWPDRMLIRALGHDLAAESDGHDRLRDARDLFMLYSRRFKILSFDNPAGYLGWILGYPEKYRPSFAAAGKKGIARVLSLCSALKRTPLVGVIMRFANAVSNHCENYFGLTGGGSCFAHVKKPT
jgi:ubiquinone/menaquinone biosynthesis C-methylase UbiE